ncbi:hypothetical protein ACLOJK_040333 [Asimina triloba]
MDSGLFLSLSSHIDAYCPPRKRSRIHAAFAFQGDWMEQEKRPSIDDLPDECLFEIFRRLPGAQERSVCAGVSKRWLMLQSTIRRAEVCTSKPGPLKEATRPVSDKVEEIAAAAVNEEDETKVDGHLTRCLEGKKATDIRLAAISVGTCSRGGLGKLQIRGNNSTRGVTDVGLTAIGRGCPSLRVLSLWNIASVGDGGLCEIADGCQMLEKLDLCRCPSISDKGIIAIANNCPNLKSLTIESCPMIGNESLQAISRGCPKLSSISIKDCPLVGDQGVASLVSSASYVLTKIKLEALKVTDISLAVIGHYGVAITDIVLTGLQNVGERGFWVLSQAIGLQKLRSFTVTSCAGLTDLGMEALGKRCPNLGHLCLRKCPLVSDEGLKAFTGAAASLESLNLEECNQITQMGILGSLSNCGDKLKALSLVKCLGIKDTVSGLPPLSPCKSLLSLTIRNCPGFGSLGLVMVGKLCPRLQHIDLGGLCRMTDAGFLALLEGCESGLVKVNLAGCIGLTDAVVLTLAKLHGCTLEVLSLDGCRMVTDKSMEVIADYCTQLVDLDVSKCMITDAGVSALAHAVVLDLQILSLFGCSLVSDKSMPFLQTMGGSLVGLNLQQCNRLSSGAVGLLGEQLWRCDILF